MILAYFYAGAPFVAENGAHVPLRFQHYGVGGLVLEGVDGGGVAASVDGEDYFLI